MTYRNEPNFGSKCLTPAVYKRSCKFYVLFPGFATASHEKENDQQNYEYIKYDLCNTCKSAGDAGKTQNGCNERNNEKSDGPTYHKIRIAIIKINNHTIVYQ